MHYYKVRAGMYAAHRDDPKTLARPEVSQVGYVQRDGKGWYAYTPNGIEVAGSHYATQDGAAKALEAFASFTVARASWVGQGGSMPEYFIKGTKQATVPVQYLVKADTPEDALRLVYDRHVAPMIIGQPELSWDTTIREQPREITQ